MLEKIIITRHGFRSNWANTAWSPSPTGIDADPSLSAHGTAQSLQLADHLCTTGGHGPIDKIYSSPFYRCVQTIAYTARASHQQIHIENGIGEWYGVVSHRTASHPSPATVSHLQRLFPPLSSHCKLIHEGYQAQCVPSTRGESMADIHARAKHAIDLIIADAEAAGCKTILLCTHAATNIALGRALCGDATRTIPTPCASVAVYLRKEAYVPGRLGGWQVERLGDCSFLEDGAERDWDF
ncbi:histidine phosphatase superfamily, partial [Protomyces lactucae-debilis]